MKFRKDATIRPPQIPGIENDIDYKEIKEIRPFLWKPSALNIPY